MKSLKHIFTLIAAITISIGSFGQCDSEVELCASNFTNEYISDGQVYQALLYGDQTAEFKVTLFGGSTYRISAYSGEGEGNLIFRILDREGNELFNNNDYSNSSYWDFTLDSTLDCKVECQLDTNKKDSGCGVVLIGFKK